MTDRVVTFANEIARGIRKDFPGKMVGFYAYVSHSQPPVRVKPEPEVLVGVTRSNYDLLHLVPEKDGDSATKFYQLIEDWKKLTPHVFTYEYNPIYWNGSLLCPNYLEWAQTIKETLALGSIGTYTDGLLAADNLTNFLNFYFYFRISADSDIDPRTELSEICDVFYGPAAKPMLDYYLTMAKVTGAVLDGSLGGGTRHYDAMFNPEMIETARKHLAAAIQASGPEEPFFQRVFLADLNQQYLEAYLDGVWNAQENDYEGSVAAFDRMEGILPKLKEANLLSDTEVFGLKAVQRRMSGVRLSVLANYFPDTFGMVRRWQVLGPFDNSTRGAEQERDVFQPISSINKPVRMADGSTQVWKTYESPSGFMDFRTALAPINPDWTAIYAYVGIRVSTPKKRRAEMRLDSFNSFRVYINGRESFYRPGWDSDLPDKRKVPVILEAGENMIVIKCTHTSDTFSFPWGLWFRITDRAGKPVEDLTYFP